MHELEPLYVHIRKFSSLSKEEEMILASLLTTKTIRKKEFILQEGKLCASNHFIIKGCLRMFTITEEGQEQIIHFGVDNWWLTDYMTFGTGKISELNIQAVEETLIVVLDYKKQEELFRRVPALERSFRLILQKAYAAALMRVKFIFTQSGEERFRHFNKSFPEFVQRVPQYMLASYLGFTPEFLSKIRAKK